MDFLTTSQGIARNFDSRIGYEQGCRSHRGSEDGCPSCPSVSGRGDKDALFVQDEGVFKEHSCHQSIVTLFQFDEVYLKVFI